MSRSKVRGVAAALAAALALLSASACASDTAGSESDTLTVGFVVDPSWAQIPVAQRGGAFERHGVRVEVVNFSTGVQALQALQGGQVDIATAADVPSASALAKSPELRVVGDGSRWTGSRIVARPGIADLNALAGKKIGTPLGTSAAYFAASALDSAGVTAELVQVAPSAMTTAIAKGDVDAVSIFQPYQAQVIDVLDGTGVEIDVPATGYRQHSLYLAAADTAQRKADAFRKFFAALTEAGAQLTAHEEAATAAVAEATALAHDLVGKVLREFDFTLQLPPDLAAKLTTLADWARARNYLDPGVPPVDYAARLDASALAES
ncbi:ABC transporter substrate-binding protein [Nocardia puris]|uniref:NitT/TauT family transport system substrate-binding protein n=1 Tax=Nocardia puris TaxID=208602 RepID=A0A366DH89_9NOCA|nr:ABC transporter substrate-binding protein [Nocardia puris]MBF6213268.1 ABC transporter substrate-binding protein [Nocardia puris]MBF6369860.1 ABC transporter substrate-binding protein [Nocardia puris]MBF6462147.1 ABC transporter substrate-binding protein [Nocardia puris]RBO89450.1 NitT/TauT family transport system substrate-binding protein [Nocardia puris]